jgi:hypothetical protein
MLSPPTVALLVPSIAVIGRDGIHLRRASSERAPSDRGCHENMGLPKHCLGKRCFFPGEPRAISVLAERFRHPLLLLSQTWSDVGFACIRRSEWFLATKSAIGPRWYGTLF